MTIADIPPGKSLGPRARYTEQFDYSHVLAEEARVQGLTLHIHDTEDEDGGKAHFRAVLHQGATRLGAVVGHVGSDSLEPHADQDLAPECRGQGLGRAMYEAVYRHALANGIARVSGGRHSPEARRVHESLAKRYGLAYDPEPERGAYSYAIKSAPSLGVPLLNCDVKYADLSQTARQLGREEHNGGRHVVWQHPQRQARPVTMPAPRDRGEHDPFER